MKKLIILFSVFMLMGCNRFEDQRIDLGCEQSKLLVPNCVKDTASIRKQALEEDRIYHK